MILLLALVLPQGKALGAGAEFAGSMTGYNNLLDMGSTYSEEMIGTTESQYQDYINQTVSLIREMAYAMNENQVYRIALEAGYGDEGTVLNQMANAKSVWKLIGTTGVRTIAGDVSFTGDMESVYRRSIYDSDSMNAVAIGIRKILGERAGNIGLGSSPEDIWNTVCGLSKQDFGENGGEQAFDPALGDDNYVPSVGDIVLFSMTASLAGKSHEGSYTIYDTYYLMGGSDSSGKIYDGKESYTLTPGSSVTLTWIGIVTDVDASGLASAVCGNVHLSGLGSIGHMDLATGANPDFGFEGSHGGETLASGLSGSYSAPGTVKLDPVGDNDPVWSLSITTKYCHNKIDMEALKRSFYASFRTVDGGYFEVDPNRPDLIECLKKEQGLSEYEARLAAMKIHGMQTFMNLTVDGGFTQVEANALMYAMFYMAEEEQDGMSPDTVGKCFPKETRELLQTYIDTKCDGVLNYDTLSGFIVQASRDGYMLNKDGKEVSTAPFQRMHDNALMRRDREAGSSHLTREDALQYSLGDAFALFGVSLDSKDIKRIIDGRTIWNLNTPEGQYLKFLKGIVLGKLDMEYKVPNGQGGVFGVPTFKNNLRNTFRSVTVANQSVLIREQSTRRQSKSSSLTRG